MRRMFMLIVANLLMQSSFAHQINAAQPQLTAAEIVNKNIQARGGLERWRAVQTISFTGKMAAGGNQRAALPEPAPGRNRGHVTVPARPREEVQLPFVWELKRPDKSRLELQFNGQTAVQVYDGQSGWKLRPYLGRNDVEAFTADELKASSQQFELDGPLVDFARKGTQVVLEGTEKVEGRD